MSDTPFPDEDYPDGEEGPIFDRDERVMVMGGINGWKVELWAPRGGDSLTLREGFRNMMAAEFWADEVRVILTLWEEEERPT